MPKFVKVCKNDFTTFHNAMWKDSTLDYPERGLLGTMLTLPDNWNFSIKGLAALAPSGEHKIGTSLKKLEKAGYLKREAIRSNGRIIDWKYSFSDEPIFRIEDENSDTETTPSESVKSKAKEAQRINKTSTEEYSEVVKTKKSLSKESRNVEKCVENYVENHPETPDCGNRNVVKNTPPESPDCGFQDVGTSDLKKRNAYQILSNQILSNNLSIYQTKKSKVEKANVENFSDEIDEIDYSTIIADVEEQIMADRLREEKEPEIINEIIDVLVSMLVTKQRYRNIGGDKLSVGLIQKRMRQLTYEHIVYVIECLANTTTEIRNRRSYILTCLYHAPITMDGYYSNQVAHHLYS